MIRRSLLSSVIDTHEPSPGCEEWSSSILKPGNVCNASAGVACLGLMVAPANTSPQGCTPSLPKLRGFVQSAVANDGFSQPETSLSDASHVVSVTRAERSTVLAWPL